MMSDFLKNLDTDPVSLHAMNSYFITIGGYELSAYEVEQLKDKFLPTKFRADESLCDAENITQAFNMLKECETEKEKAPIKRYLKQLIAEANKNPYKKWEYTFAPIKWEKQWDSEVAA